MIGRTNACVISGSTDFGYTVNFISDGAQYAKYIVTDGQSVSAPKPNPTKTGMWFYGWKDPSGNAITFPYTPSDDIVLTALFVTYRADMCLTEANKTICRLDGRRYYKTNSGWAIAGYGYIDGFTRPVLVALSAEAADITAEGFGSVGTGGSFVYHDITYYYPGYENSMGGNQISTSTDVADLYKCTESTMEAAALTLVKRYLYEI